MSEKKSVQKPKSKAVVKKGKEDKIPVSKPVSKEEARKMLQHLASKNQITEEMLESKLPVPIFMDDSFIHKLYLKMNCWLKAEKIFRDKTGFISGLFQWFAASRAFKYKSRMLAYIKFRNPLTEGYTFTVQFTGSENPIKIIFRGKI